MLIEASDIAPGTQTPYTTNLPLDEAMLPDVLLVHSWEGKPLPREHGGPGADDHAAALLLEGREVDPADHVQRGGSAGVLGGPRLLEHGVPVVRRSVRPPLAPGRRGG